MSSSFTSMDKNSMEKLRLASEAEAEAASAVWQAVQASTVPAEETSVSEENSQAAGAASDGNDNEADVRLHPRAVCLTSPRLCIMFMQALLDCLLIICRHRSYRWWLLKRL